MTRFKRPKRVLGQLLLWQVMRQEDEELLTTAHTLFMFSLTLLFAAIVLTGGLVLVGHLPGGQGGGATLQTLDNYGLYAVVVLMFPTLLSVLIKGGSFERVRAPCLWISFMCILAGMGMILRMLVPLALCGH